VAPILEETVLVAVAAGGGAPNNLEKSVEGAQGRIDHEAAPMRDD